MVLIINQSFLYKKKAKLNKNTLGITKERKRGDYQINILYEQRLYHHVISIGV
jgi:hypothetical protein